VGDFFRGFGLTGLTRLRTKLLGSPLVELSRFDDAVVKIALPECSCEPSQRACLTTRFLDGIR
jgi:hypothetical protein